MPSALVVKVPKRCDGAPAKRQVVGVDVWVAARSRAEVDGAAWKYAVFKVYTEVRVSGKEGAETITIVLVGFWGPSVEGAYALLASATLQSVQGARGFCLLEPSPAILWMAGSSSSSLRTCSFRGECCKLPGA